MITYLERYRLLAMCFKKRSKKDAITWIVFFFLTICFCIVYLWFLYTSGKTGKASFLESIIGRPLTAGDQYPWALATLIILRASAAYILFLMFPVYINLLFLKKNTLDKINHRIWSYVVYLFSVILNACFFSGIIFAMFWVFPQSFRIKPLDFPLNLLIISGVQFIASGMKYRKQVWDLLSLIKFYEKLIKEKKKELKELKLIITKNENGVASDHIKVGNTRNYWIIPHTSILYLEGDGNEPVIYTADEKGKYRGSESMSNYTAVLPQSHFLRIHRSYIVNKKRVIKRKGNKLFLRGFENKIIEVPIGNTYDSAVGNDPYLGG